MRCNWTRKYGQLYLVHVHCHCMLPRSWRWVELAMMQQPSALPLAPANFQSKFQRPNSQAARQCMNGDIMDPPGSVPGPGQHRMGSTAHSVALSAAGGGRPVH